MSAREIVYLFVGLLSVTTAAEAATASKFSHATLGALAKLQPGETLAVDAFPAGPTRRSSIRFERVDVYAPGAHILVEDANGRHEIPHSKRVFLRGYSDDGTFRIALSVNPDASAPAGGGSGAEGPFVLRPDPKDHALLAAISRDASLPAGQTLHFTCANDSAPFTAASLQAELVRAAGGASPSAATATSSNALRLATVAIDTDTLFMSRLFANDTTQAADWIAGMFNAMNTMYERDLLVRLQLGQTILRIVVASDPYTSLGSGAASGTDLDLFAAYWKASESGVTRAFAALLSGQLASDASGCTTSGIAWINEYCQNGFISGADTVGSYSINKVCTDLSIDPDGSFDALTVGHELGHNFGANHTHCTDATTGAFKTASNTIDKCFNTESDCYASTASCPTNGPGEPAGTIMSYCNNYNMGQGCGPDGQNVLQFHPTQINPASPYSANGLLAKINAAPVGCFNTTDDIFYSGFD